MKNKLFYFETDIDCGLRLGNDKDEVFNEIRAEVGTVNNIQTVREATLKDINWVKSMGGHVPLTHN